MGVEGDVESDTDAVEAGVDTDPRHIFDTLYAPLKHAFYGVVLGV